MKKKVKNFWRIWLLALIFDWPPAEAFNSKRNSPSGSEDLNALSVSLDSQPCPELCKVDFDSASPYCICPPLHALAPLIERQSSTVAREEPNKSTNIYRKRESGDVFLSDGDTRDMGKPYSNGGSGQGSGGGNGNGGSGQGYVNGTSNGGSGSGEGGGEIWDRFKNGPLLYIWHKIIRALADCDLNELELYHHFFPNATFDGFNCTTTTTTTSTTENPLDAFCSEACLSGNGGVACSCAQYPIG